MKKIILFLSLGLLLIFSSCSSMNVSGSMRTSMDGVNTLGVLTVNYAERILPVIPLVDAGIHNGVVKKNMEELQMAEADNAKEVTAELSSALKTFSGLTPVVVEGDASSFEVGKVDVVWAQKMMEENGLDAIAIATTSVSTTGASAFGMKGFNKLNLQLQIIAADGTTIAYGTFVSEVTKLSPGNVSGYSVFLRSTNVYISELISKIFA